MQAGHEIDPEVDAGGEHVGISDAICDDALGHDLLEVGAAAVEQEREFLVVKRQLGDGRVERPEPEREAASGPDHAAIAIADDVARGLRAEVGDARRNAGLVLLLVPRKEGVPNSGKIQVAVGQGLEGIVTDAAAGQVSDLMLPELREGKYGPALLTGTRALAARVAQGYGVSDSSLTTGPSAGPPAVSVPQRSLFRALFPILLFLLFMGLSGRGRRRRGGIYWGGPWIGGGGGASGGGAGRSF